VAIELVQRPGEHGRRQPEQEEAGEIAVGATDVDVLVEMAWCLREVGAGRVSR